MFTELQEKLSNTFAKLRGRGVLTESDIKEGLREVRRVLLEADVNFQLSREFLERVEAKAVGTLQVKNVQPAQQLVKIVYDELVVLLGERREGLRLSSVPPTVVMLVGLQGSGKTTTAAKLARRLKVSEGRQVRLIALDVYRPAAIDQLETLGRDLEIPVFADRSTNDVVKIARAGLEVSRSERDRVVLLDTAGRLQIDDEMMDELRRLKDAVRPDEILLVADGMTGQEAVKIAQGFDASLGLTGVILTKLDGDARGGARSTVSRRNPSSTSAPAKRPMPSRSSTPTEWRDGFSSRATSFLSWRRHRPRWTPTPRRSWRKRSGRKGWTSRTSLAP
jgi:signal recognition particle subunit SRP54